MLVVNIISGFSTIVLLQFLSEVFESEQLVTQKHGRYLVPRQSRVVASICKLFTRPHWVRDESEVITWNKEGKPLKLRINRATLFIYEGLPT